MKYIKLNMVRSFSVVLLSVLISACGFHLKGYGSSDTASFKTVYFVSTSAVRSDVLNAIKTQFKQTGIKIVNQITDAEIVVNLSTTTFVQSNTSLSRTGDITSQELSLTQAYLVEDNAGNIILNTQSTVREDRNIDINAIAASARELESIQARMVFSVAQSVYDRINRGVGKHNK